LDGGTNIVHGLRVPVDGELLFYAHFLRFCNLDTMNRARSGCPFSPLDCHYRSGQQL